MILSKRSVRTTGTRANTLELMRRTTVRACAVAMHRCLRVFSPQLLITDANSTPGASHCRRNIVPCALVRVLVPLTHTAQCSRNHAARPAATRLFPLFDNDDDSSYTRNKHHKPVIFY